ncbi:hypothetical protein [uncultured Desulfosarcina sp.]|uniref:hypothetical protein n=1 Tax=uncultured Desulfosarcina sp. TaxID=218289 RepID=UPI0029C7F198|nr:hypothetical protein [uncultured Desulfosarcina sp.]
MKHKTLTLLLSLVLAGLCAFGFGVHASDADLTPLPGNPLRKQVLDALRTEVKRRTGLDVVFVVKQLRVKDGWAWVHTLPQSRDGNNRYEDISALLRFSNGAWEVAEIPCGEVDNPDCLNGPEYFHGLRERFPTVTAEIFPDWARISSK